MKTDFFNSVLKHKKIFLKSKINEINTQTNKKFKYNQRNKIKSAKFNKNKKDLILSQNNNEIKNLDSSDELNIEVSNKYMQTMNNEKTGRYEDLQYNLKTLKTEVKDSSTSDKISNNNLSIYSTFWYNEHQKYKKTYYLLNNKENAKKARDLLKKSENFNKYIDDRYIIGMLNKFKNKTFNVSEHKKYQQFSYKRRIPIKIAFGSGKSNNEIPEIFNNYNFNKTLKQQQIKKIKSSKKINDVYKKGFNITTDSKLSKNSQKLASKSSQKPSLFITDSSTNKFHPKDSFGKEVYSILTKHKILKNILPKGVDYNTRIAIEDIINSEIFPLLRHQQKVIVQNTNLLSQELNILFGQIIRLCKKENNFGGKGEKLELEIKDKFIELMRSIIKKHEVKEEKKINENNADEINKKKERKKYLLNKFKEVIILAYQKIKKYNIDINIFYSLMDYNKNDSHFQMELISNGQYLFKAIKAGDIPEVIKFIDKNKYLVAYKDDFNQIPLHICAKRNLYELIYFLLSRLSSIDAQDLGGRTPLMIAAKNNFFEFATILLFEGADPTFKDVYGNKASQMTNNENLRIVLRRGEVLYNLRYFYKGKNFLKFIENGLDFLLKKELDIDYEQWLKKGEKIIKEYS